MRAAALVLQDEHFVDQEEDVDQEEGSLSVQRNSRLEATTLPQSRFQAAVPLDR